jgi:hypothetical protein
MAAAIAKLVGKGWRIWKPVSDQVVMYRYRDGDFSGWCIISLDGTISGNVSDAYKTRSLSVAKAYRVAA